MSRFETSGHWNYHLPPLPDDSFFVLCLCIFKLETTYRYPNFIQTNNHQAMQCTIYFLREISFLTTKYFHTMQLIAITNNSVSWRLISVLRGRFRCQLFHNFPYLYPCSTDDTLKAHCYLGSWSVAFVVGSRLSQGIWKYDMSTKYKQEYCNNNATISARGRLCPKKEKRMSRPIMKISTQQPTLPLWQLSVSR